MLIPTMTYKEMYNHLANDLKKVQIREDYLRRKAIKEFKAERKFPAWRWYEYTIPATNNKYIIFFYAESRFFIEKPIADSFCIMFNDKQRFIIQWIAGGYKQTEDSPISFIRQIHAYTSHFLERYNERFLKDKTLNANDIACRYLSRNKIGMPITMSEDINKNLEKYGENAQTGYRVKDGFCFARSAVEGTKSEDGDRNKDKVNAMLVLYTTFMNEAGLANTQLSAINEEHYNTWLRSIQDIQKEAKDGIITVQLEP